jgi:uncharacterized protein (TIGR00369 family)
MSETFAAESLFGDNRNEFVDWVPHCAEIGMRCLRVGPRSATMVVPYRDDFVGDPERGVVFGGLITTLLDHAGGGATLCSLPEIAPIATIDLRIDYLRAAVPGEDLHGRAECYKRTRSVAFVRGVAWDRDEADPFAHFIATYMLGSSEGEHPLKRLAAAGARATGAGSAS